MGDKSTGMGVFALVNEWFVAVFDWNAGEFSPTAGWIVKRGDILSLCSRSIHCGCLEIWTANHSKGYRVWCGCHGSLIHCFALECKRKSASVITDFVVAVKISDLVDDRIVRRIWWDLSEILVKNKSLSLSSGVVLNWRFDVSNRQCHCQNCDEKHWSVCISLLSCLSLCASNGLRPPSLSSLTKKYASDDVLSLLLSFLHANLVRVQETLSNGWQIDWNGCLCSGEWVICSCFWLKCGWILSYCWVNSEAWRHSLSLQSLDTLRMPRNLNCQPLKRV